MACLYDNYDMVKDALRYELEALDLNRRVLSSDHINIARSLRNIGLLYERMNNLPEALRYFNESLSIYKLNYGSEHEKVKQVEKDIARLNEEQSSPTTNELEKENIEEEPSVDPDTLSIHPKLESDCANNNKSSTIVRSKCCIIQ